MPGQSSFDRSVRTLVLGGVLALATLPSANQTMAQQPPAPPPTPTRQPDALETLLSTMTLDLAVGLLGSGIIAAAGFGAGKVVERRREEAERQRITSGDRISGSSRFQVHSLHVREDGEKVLVFRPIPPMDSWGNVLGSEVLEKEIREAAKRTSADNPVLSIPQQYRPAVFTVLRNSLSTANLSVPGPQRECLVFLTCEDSQNKIPDFQTAIRGFVIAREDLAHFADLDNVRKTYVEDAKFAFRLLALHYIAVGVQKNSLVDGTDFVRVSLPVRDDYKALSDSNPVDWSAIVGKYEGQVDITSALSELAMPRPQGGAPEGTPSIKT
jgi:hypothetical protein